MRDIDFLPSRFREKHARRKARITQLGILLLFLLGVAAASVGQLTLRRSVQRNLADVQPRYERAVRRHTEFSDLSRRLREAEHVAQLYAYLQHPWPRTQLLSELVRDLPASIALRDVSVVLHTPPASPVASARIDLAAADTAAHVTPAEKDLEALRKLFDQQRVIIEAAGHTQDASELHAYVARLDQARLFQSAKLESLETRAAGEAATFRIRLQVKPGYGQAGGPSGPPEDTPHVLARVSGPRPASTDARQP